MDAGVEQVLPQKPNWFRARVLPYLVVTKPASVWLLVFTAVGGMVVAGGAAKPLDWWVLALSAITAGCAGANTLTCYIDRDMDSVMERTRRRPLPGGQIKPPERALVWGLFLAGLSLVLAWLLNPLACLWMALGLFDNVVIYSLWAKRRTCINIILGSVSGGMPTLFGWSAVRGDVTWLPVLMGLLVVLWTPNHIWSLAIRYRDDYARAGVPMLPVVHNVRRSVAIIAAAQVLTFLTSLALYAVGGFGPLYLCIAIASGTVVVLGQLYLLVRPTPANAWLMFKVSSPHLFLLFLSMILDALRRGTG